MERKIRVTKLMRQVEAKFQRPLMILIPELAEVYDLTECAEEMGISKATLGYWMLKLGIEVRRIAVCPGETLEVVKEVN